MKKRRILQPRGISALFLASAILMGSLNGCTVSTTVPGETPETTEEETLFSSGRKVYLAGDPMDFTISEKDDYYGAINAKALWNQEVKYGQNTAGAFEQVYQTVEDETDAILRRILSENQNAEKGSPEELLWRIGKQAKETSGREENRAVFEESFHLIDSAKTPKELLLASAALNYRYDVNGIIGTQILSDPNNTSRNVLILSYGDTIYASLKDITEDPEKAESFRNALNSALYDLGMEKEEAGSTSYRIAHRFLDLAMKVDFTGMEKYGSEAYMESFTWKEAEKLFGSISLEEFLTANGLTNREIDYLKEQDALKIVFPEVLSDFLNSVNEETLADWRSYLKCVFTSRYSSYAPSGFTRTDEKNTELTEEKLFTFLKSEYAGLISPVYYTETYTPEKDRIMKDMEEAFRKEYPAMIESSSYLSEETKALLVEKFQNIRFHFGGEPYEGSFAEGIDPLEDTLLETLIRYHKEFNDHLIASLSEKPDPDHWEMSAQTVNAYYQPYSNNIYITSAILHAPFFDPKADMSTNYGGIGCVIAHELSHAFDKNGLQFDQDGNYRPDWIAEQDRKKMEEQYEKIRKHYDRYTLLDIYHVNGEQTLAENMADLGGVQCVLRLLSTKEEYRKCFENYAKIWSTLYRKEDLLMYLDEDTHSPSLVRVNAVLSCFDEFYETYDVREGDGMYLVPEERLTRW